ncbi:MAG: TrmB family transcriptional regulator [Desulfotomaculales bacterium]
MDKLTTDVFESLVEFGLTVYEAKAYVALLRQHPSKARDISKNSGVPAAKVYDVMSRLVDKGLAVPVGSDPVLYEPLPAKEFVRLRRTRFERLADRVEEQLGGLSSKPSAEVLWHIRGYENLLAKVQEIISKAEKQVLFSIWTPQIVDLCKDLKEAHSRGVMLIIIQMGDDPPGCPEWPVGRVYRHMMVPTVYERHGSELLVSADDQNGLMMNRAAGRDWEGFWTSNQAIVRVITNYIRHDIYLAKIALRYGEMLKGVYGDDLAFLLNVEEDRIVGEGGGE